MEWLVIDEKYLDYLRIIDSRIPYSDYGENRYKPFFGVLFETEHFCYVTQIAHAQSRHQNMKANLDFKKLFHPKDNSLIAVVNLNYMFPIPKNMKKKLEYKDIGLHRQFETEEEKSKYIDLMKIELNMLNNMNLEKSAKIVYDNKYTKKNKTLAARCIDFKKMEEMAIRYDSNDLVHKE